MNIFGFLRHKKEKEVDIDFPKIDLHAHLLPGVDDGSTDEECSALMLDAAVRSGIIYCNATAHHQTCCMPTFDEIEKAWQKLQLLRDARQPQLKLSVSLETAFFHGATDFLQQAPFAMIGESPLIEFDSDITADTAQNALFKMAMAQMTPVVVHPERFGFVQKKPEIAEEMQKRGALLMINSGSFTGRYGHHAQDTVHWLCRHHVADALASDAHRPEYYDDYTAACKIIASQYGVEFLRTLTWDGPCQIIGSEPKQN